MGPTYRKRSLLLTGALWPHRFITALSAFASFNSLPPSPPSRAAWRRTPALIKSRVSSSTGLISGVPAIGNAASICQGTYHEKEGSVELFEAGTDQQEAEASAGAATDRLELRGPIIDLLTPFTSEGDVDFAAFGEYLRFLAQAGVRTVLCNGEAGEFESLTIDERRVLLDLARATFAGTVLNHVSASALPDVTRLISRSSSKFRDGPRTMADAVVLTVPFAQSRSRFGGVTRVADEVGSEAFLRRALKGCDLPVFLYSSPGSPISPELYSRLSEDFPAIRGIVYGGDAEISMELKKALPSRHLLLAFGDRGPRVGGEKAPSVNAISAAETAEADACIMTASCPLTELAVRMQACLDRGDRSGARHAQRELETWTKKRQTVAKASESEIAVVKAAIGARVPGFPLHTRPPLRDLDREAAEDVMRWVSNNEGVRREKRSAHIRRISTQLSDVYRRAWNSVEVAGLELLFEQLSASEERLLGYLENAKRQRAELDERSAMSASESEVEAARLLSDVMDARRRLEEDADREVSVEVMPTATEMPTAKERPKTKEMPTAKERSSATDSAGAGLKERLEDARAIAARSQGRLGSLRSLKAEVVENVAASAVVTDFDHADRDSEETHPVVSSPVTPSINGDVSGDVDSSVENTVENSAETSVFDLVNGAMSEPVNGAVNGDVSTGSASHDVSLSGAEFSTETARPIAGGKKVAPTSPVVPSSSLAPEEHTAASSGKPRVPVAPSIGELAWGAKSKNSAPGVNGAVGDAASAGAGVAAVATRTDAAEEMEVASARITSFQRGSGVGWEGDRGRFGPAELALSEIPDSEAGEVDRNLAGGRFGDPEDGSAFGASAASAASGWDPTSSSIPHNAQSLPRQQQQQSNQAEPGGDYRNEQPWQRGGSTTNSIVGTRARNPEEQTALVEGETMSSSPAQALDPGASRLREAMPSAQESLEIRAVFGGSGRGEATSGPDVCFEKSRSKAQSNIKRRAALPTPRYGRYIPEGSPPKTPKTLSPAFPFQANPAPRPHSRGGQSRQPAPRHHHSHTVPSKRERGTTALGEGGNGDLSGRGGRKGVVDGQIGVESRRGGLQWGQGRGGMTKKFEATVDDFREKEKETFFKSKGIDGDVDSFNWDQLRRNTLEIENLQREAVDRYRRRQGGDSDHRYPRR